MMLLKWHKKFSIKETQYLIAQGWTVEGDRRHAIKGNIRLKPDDLKGKINSPV